MSVQTVPILLTDSEITALYILGNVAYFATAPDEEYDAEKLNHWGHCADLYRHEIRSAHDKLLKAVGGQIVIDLRRDKDA